jgi:hypothetical protein
MNGVLRRSKQVFLLIGIVLSLAGSGWISIAGSALLIAVITLQKIAAPNRNALDQLSNKGT